MYQSTKNLLMRGSILIATLLLSFAKLIIVTIMTMVKLNTEFIFTFMILFVEASDNDLLLTNSEKEESRVLANSNSAYSAPTYELTGPVETSAYSSSSIDDLFGLGLSIPPPPPSLNLNPKAVIDPGAFQKKWGQLTISSSQECPISPQGIPGLSTPQVLQKHMQSHSIHCIASGGQAFCKRKLNFS